MKAAEDHLRGKGLRVTAQRVCVLNVLEEMPHTSAEAVAREVRDRVGSVSTQGIYNVVNDLVAAGLITRIEVGGGPALYELARDGIHHHVICRECGRVVDLDCEHGDSSCLRPPGDLGFTEIEAEIVFWGTCAACHEQRLAGAGNE